VTISISGRLSDGDPSRQVSTKHGTKSFVQTERQQREGDRGVSYCMALLAIRYSGVATSSLHGANEPAELCVCVRERACGDRKEIKLRRGQENKDDASCSAVRPDGDPWIFQSMNSHGRREPRLFCNSIPFYPTRCHVGPCL